MKAKAKKQSNLIRFLTAPIKILNRFTEFYMNSMFHCARRIGENTVVNCGVAPQVPQQLPRNFSVSSSQDSKQEEEFRELIRAVSTKLAEAKVEIKTVDQLKKPSMGPTNVVEKRSYSVGIGRIGRIDEEMPCDFKEADANAYPRSKSYAVTGKRRVR